MYIGMVSIVVVCICIQLYKKVYEKDKIVEIPREEIYSQDMTEENVFIEAIIVSEENYREYAKRYNFDFDISQIDFSENRILLTSRHEVKSLSYNEKNRKYSSRNRDILDIIFYQEETEKFYFYEIPFHLTTWESVGRNKEHPFEE